MSSCNVRCSFTANALIISEEKHDASYCGFALQTPFFRTGTFKLKKTKLQEEGYDLSKLGEDPAFVMDHKAGGRFVRLTEQIVRDINQGKMKL